jgi:hypothetical protein
VTNPLNLLASRLRAKISSDLISRSATGPTELRAGTVLQNLMERKDKPPGDLHDLNVGYIPGISWLSISR